jgi:hypothetical protein
MLPFAVQSPQPPAIHYYAVQSGDTLWGIAQQEYNNSNDWVSIYDANRNLVRDPALILPHWKLVIPDHPTPTAYVPQHSAGYAPSHAADPPPVLISQSELTPAQVGALWVAEGGPGWAEPEAECIAYHESGDVPTANNYDDNGGTQTSFGLFQISNGTHEEPVPNIDNPIVNTRQAVLKFEASGATFSVDWGTAPDC